jgi:hypothetical protein
MNNAFINEDGVTCYVRATDEDTIVVELADCTVNKKWGSKIYNGKGDGLPTDGNWTIRDGDYYNLGKMIFEHKYGKGE